MRNYQMRGTVILIEIMSAMNINISTIQMCVLYHRYQVLDQAFKKKIQAQLLKI